MSEITEPSPTSQGRVAAITLFVADPAISRVFYTRVFEREAVQVEQDLVIFQLDDLYLLLRRESAAEVADLLAGQRATVPGGGVRMQVGVSVDDIEGTALRLRDRGVILASGPVDRAWGVRAVTLFDPDGNSWELAQG